MPMSLENKKTKKRANIKAKQIKNKTRKGFFEKGKYRVELLDINEIDGGVEVFVRAWKNNKQLGFGKDGSVEIERFNIYNPPILVPDDNGDIVRVQEENKELEIERKEFRYREDPEEAIKLTLEHNINIVGKENGKIIKGKVGKTTSTFYPDSSVESTSVDGYTADVGGGGSNWATAHDRTTCTTPSDTATVLVTRCDNASGSYRIYRSFTLFDTSSIPDADTIDSATLSLWFNSINNAQSDSIGIVQTSPASNTAIVADDFNNFTAIHSQTATAEKTLASISTGAYTDFAFDATGLTWIDKTGITKLGQRQKNDYSETASHSNPASGGNTSTEYRSADTAGTTNDPKLVVEHTTAVTFTPKVMWFN